VLFAGNIAWEAWVPKRGLDLVSVCIIWIELALLLTILFTIAICVGSLLAHRISGRLAPPSE
jgi:hypothetical protein